MRKAQRGSMTVEASILTVLILFLLMAVIYLLFFLHDRIVMQSCGLRSAEDLLWQREKTSVVANEVNVDQLPVFMLKISDISLDTEKNMMTEILNLMGSCEKAKVRMEGQLSVAIPGSAVFTGATMGAGASAKMIRICYVEDRLKSVFLQRQKGKEE